VGFDELSGTNEFRKELEERLAKAQVIFYEGESSSFNHERSNSKTRRRD